MQKKEMFLFFLLKTEYLNTSMYKKNYTSILLKTFPSIANGRKNFKYFEKRIKQNLLLTSKYIKRGDKKSL